MEQAELKGNLLIAQSGGPTVVINSTVAGVVEEALNHDCIGEIYGAMYGIRGLLGEHFVDLASESQRTIRGLRYTPGAALGSCRYHIKDKDYDTIFENLTKNNIRYLFYAGGNGSQMMIKKLAEKAKEIGYDMRAIGLPKTIDNDLVVTDHSPGYGSVVKYIAATTREIAIDDQSMGDYDLVSIVEVMGRDAGWIAAGSVLAREKNSPMSAPHLIYLPERPFEDEAFLESVQRVLETNRYCLVVVAEGIRNKEGNYIQTSGIKDPLGRTELGGAAEYLQGLVETRLKIKARTTKLGIAQRCAAHCSSLQDNEEAYQCGVHGVRFAVAGHSKQMVTIVRESESPYRVSYSLTSLDSVASLVKNFPNNWIDSTGTMVTSSFLRYVAPLIQGEVPVPYKNGLPECIHLDGLKMPAQCSLKRFF